jgi:hypothetical protein
MSAWLGTVIGLQKAPEKQLAVIWHLARAAYIDDEGALAPAQRREIRALLEALYTAYHGGLDGLDQVGALTKSAVFPAPDFQIETAAAVAERRREEELLRTNPELAAWLKIRKQLEAPDGETYFTQTLSAAPLPKLKGAVVRYSPPSRPKEIVIGISDPTFEEVVLKLDSPFPNTAEPGTVIEFEGSAASFTREPFSMIISVEREKVIGWPASGAR